MASRSSTSKDRTGYDYSKRDQGLAVYSTLNEVFGKPKTVTMEDLTSQISLTPG